MKTLAEVERDAIMATIQKCQDRLAAARALGIGKTTLYRKLREYGVDHVRHIRPRPEALLEVRQPKFLLLPSTAEEKAKADLICPGCRRAVLLPNGNGAHQ